LYIMYDLRLFYLKPELKEKLFLLLRYAVLL
jgi:hypothetical protein